MLSDAMIALWALVAITHAMGMWDVVAGMF